MRLDWVNPYRPSVTPRRRARGNEPAQLVFNTIDMGIAVTTTTIDYATVADAKRALAALRKARRHAVRNVQ